MAENTVLIASDQPEIADNWSHALIQRGIAVETAPLNANLSQLFSDRSFVLGIIDVNEEGFDTGELCRAIRAVFSNPLLVFTYEQDERHHLHLYQGGADETVVKPIGLLLLLAKVSSWLSRSSTAYSQSWPLNYAGFHIDTADQLLTTPDGRTVKLSKLEYRLAVVLLANRGRVVSTDVLAARVWNGHGANAGDTLKRLVYRLRRKIEPDPSVPRYVETVDGLGYRVPYATD